MASNVFGDSSSDGIGATTLPSISTKVPSMKEDTLPKKLGAIKPISNLGKPRVLGKLGVRNKYSIKKSLGGKS